MHPVDTSSVLHPAQRPSEALRLGALLGGQAEQGRRPRVQAEGPQEEPRMEQSPETSVIRKALGGFGRGFGAGEWFFWDGFLALGGRWILGGAKVRRRAVFGWILEDSFAILGMIQFAGFHLTRGLNLFPMVVLGPIGI